MELELQANYYTTGTVYRPVNTLSKDFLYHVMGKDHVDDCLSQMTKLNLMCQLHNIKVVLHA
jgi:hypothetical protein